MPFDPSSSKGSIQQINLPGYFSPFKFPLDWGSSIAVLLQSFLPPQELIGKSQMRLDDYIKATCSNKAVCSWEGDVERSHYFCDANSCAT